MNVIMSESEGNTEFIEILKGEIKRKYLEGS